MNVIKVWNITIGGQRYLKEVEGKSVKFTGFSEFEFLLHRVSRNDGFWRVSEKTSSGYFSEASTPNEALRKAKICLLEQGRINIRKQISATLKLLETFPILEVDNASK